MHVGQIKHCNSKKQCLNFWYIMLVYKNYLCLLFVKSLLEGIKCVKKYKDLCHLSERHVNRQVVEYMRFMLAHVGSNQHLRKTHLKMQPHFIITYYV